MIDEDDGDEERVLSAHVADEVDPAVSGISPEDGVANHRDVMHWRKSERARLIKERLEISADTRKKNSDCITEQLDVAIGDLSGRTVSGYWPFREIGRAHV